jgi:hypothetical protein
LLNDFIYNRTPGITFKYFFFDAFVEISDHPLIAVVNIIEFLFAKIPYTQLHQFGNLRNFLQRIMHNTRMAVIKIFVCFVGNNIAAMCIFGSPKTNHRTIFNVLIEPIKKEFTLSDTTMGLLAGFGFVLFYSLLGIPIARVADRLNRRSHANYAAHAERMLEAIASHLGRLMGAVKRGVGKRRNDD